jgi:hypothetical protein
MRILKYLVVSASMIIALSVWAQAQSSASSGERKEHRGQGYVFFAPGAIVKEGYSVATAHFGGGGEAFLYKGLGLGAEAGYVTPWQNFGNGVGLVSFNGSYHFNRDRKVSPFVSGGYTLGFRSDTANLFNFGGGVNYWFRDRVGLRFEFRDHVYSEPSFTAHYLGGRIGFSFR